MSVQSRIQSTIQNKSVPQVQEPLVLYHVTVMVVIYTDETNCYCEN